LIEVCCGSTDDAVEAEEGGAGRVELNSSLFFGGLTPSLGSIIEAKKRLSIPVI
jgi:copper homeostasis protein